MRTLRENLRDYIAGCFTGIWIETREPHEAISRRRQRKMYDATDVWNIDPHAKRAGGENDFQFSRLEFFNYERFLSDWYISIKWCTRMTLGFKIFRRESSSIFCLRLPVNVHNQSSRLHSAVTIEQMGLCENIDVKIAPLILEIWKAGIKTMMSCQGGGDGMAWIEFDSAEDILRYLNIVTRYEPGHDSFYNRVNWLLTGETELSHWEYQFNLLDIFSEREEQTQHGEVCFDATVGVNFPIEDVPFLLEQLPSFNQPVVRADEDGSEKKPRVA